MQQHHEAPRRGALSMVVAVVCGFGAGIVLALAVTALSGQSVKRLAQERDELRIRLAVLQSAEKRSVATFEANADFGFLKNVIQRFGPRTRFFALAERLRQQGVWESSQPCIIRGAQSPYARICVWAPLRSGNPADILGFLDVHLSYHGTDWPDEQLDLLFGTKFPCNPLTVSPAFRDRLLRVGRALRFDEKELARLKLLLSKFQIPRQIGQESVGFALAEMPDWVREPVAAGMQRQAQLRAAENKGAVLEEVDIDAQDEPPVYAILGPRARISFFFRDLGAAVVDLHQDQREHYWTVQLTRRDEAVEEAKFAKRKKAVSKFGWALLSPQDVDDLQQ